MSEPQENGQPIGLLVQADVATAAVVLVVVEVTAPDIATPLVFNIPVVNGVASGTITLPAGSNRTITMHVFDAGAVETHRGSVTLNIQPSATPTISLTLKPLVGNAPIQASLGSFVVTVAPAAATLPIWGTAKFTATILDANGAPVSAPVTWATANTGVASVTSDGVVTGVWVGQTRIVATYQGAAGSAPVSITALTWPNEPAGFRVLTDQGFATLADGGWQQTDGPPHTDIVLDLTAPRSPNTVLQFFYPAGFTGGVAPGTAYYDIAQPWPTEVYVGFWWKVSNPWQGHSTGVNKILYLKLPSSSKQLIVTLRAQGVNDPAAHLTVANEIGGPQFWFDPNIVSTPVIFGVWHRVELHVRASDGLLDYWLDGVQQGHYVGVYYGDGVWQEPSFSPVWGGVDDTKTEADYFWVDHIHVSAP